MSRAAETLGRTGRPSYPIAIHLAFFAIGILVPVLLIVTWMAFDTARLRREEALHGAATVMRHLNATIDVEMEKAIAVGQAMATSRMLANGDYAGFDNQARDIAGKLGVVIVVRGLSGQQLVDTAAAPGAALPVSDESILVTDRLVLARMEPMISDLVTGTVRKVPFVFADVPVVEEGKPISVLSVSLAPARLASILAEGLPEGWIAGLLGRDGRLIARSTGHDRYLGTINRPFLEVAREAEGTWTGMAREGKVVAGTYVRSPLSGWLVSVAVPEALMDAPVRWAMFQLGGIVVALLAVSGLLGWRLSRRISDPIRALAFQARVLGEGGGPVAVRSSVDELNRVTEALVAASIELDLRAQAASRAAEIVRVNEERLALVQDTAGIGTIDWDLEADRAVCSPRYYELFSFPAGSRIAFANFIARVHPAERERVERSYRELFGRGGGFEDEFRIVPPDGEEHWIYTRGQLERKNDRAVRLWAAVIDITQRKRSEEHLRFLLRELSHRSKNLLAVIQAMASQTAKSAESVSDFRRRFGERLMGLAASHDLLVNQNWLGASVGNLVRGQLAAFVEERDTRIVVQGPAVDLKAEAAEALGLALHELATNSLKYGALSDAAGKLEINWEVGGPEDNSEPDERRFRMAWIEHTVLPVVPPSHKGFGRMVIEHTVEATLRGSVTLTFPPEGVRWRLNAPATCLV